jgi:hypothetical protein
MRPSTLLRCGLCVLMLTATTLLRPAEARPAAGPVPYDIVYVRQPRKGDNTHVVWPEVFHPGRIEPNSDLVLLHPDGSEEVLVDTTDGAVTDPFVSFDGESVYYSFFPDVRPSALNYQRGDLPYKGADIYRMHIPSRTVTRLTHQEFTPNTGAGNWDESNPVDPPSQYNRLGYGILNLGPAPIAGGKIIFTSNRNGNEPTKGYTFPSMQLFVMDADGSNVTPIAPMTLGSALHPVQLRDGRVMFSTFESQGMRDSRLWGMWTIWPDGRYWQPFISAFKLASSFHFSTQLGNEDIVIEDYYNLNNFGFGALYRFPVNPPNGQPAFHNAFPNQNPPITQTFTNFVYPAYMGFTRRGLYSITPFTNAEDEASPLKNGQHVGKFTHPSAAPNNDLLVAWSGGPVNALNRPTNLPAPDAGLYLMRGGGPINSQNELVLIKNDPNYNEVWPRAVVSYAAVHGVAQPAALPWLPNDGMAHAQLPAGTPYGLIGTSSFYKRETFPGRGSAAFGGLDVFNTSENDHSSNWLWQGADAGKYGNDDIWAVRIVAMEGNTHRSYGPNNGQHFFNHVNERLRILGEIPLRKADGSGNPVLDPEGNPDTSFLAKIPADTPFTFQTLDRNGMVLNMSQTWHQVRLGEMRANCGGCHAHSQQPLDFNQTAASKPGYSVMDLSKITPLITRDANGQPSVQTVNASLVNVEFYRDIRPILQNSCAGCHTTANPSPPGQLALNDTTVNNPIVNTSLQLPNDYQRLCFDSDAKWGYPPLVKVGNDPVWRQTNASRYVRPFQSRRSLLIWKIFGQRLDGWANADHPTETTPGDASTLPAGAQINNADLDYTGDAMPPPGSPALTHDQKMLFVRWVDLGCPINTGQGSNANFGWFLDDVRPTLDVSLPRPGTNTLPVNVIRIGVADAYSGIEPQSLSITATVTINNRAPGTPLADLAAPIGDGIFAITLTQPLTNVTNAVVRVQVADKQGNVTRVNREFSTSIDLGRSTFLPAVRR